MKKVYLFSAIAMALLTACQENEALVTITNAEINSAEGVELSASINEGSTRTYLSEDGNSVCWELKDGISAFYSNSSLSKFTVRSVDKNDPTQATLFCASPNKSGEAIEHIVAIYPYDKNATLTLNYANNATPIEEEVDDDINNENGEGSVEEQEPILESYSVATTFPAEQSYKENSFGSGSSPMMAVSAGNNLTFKNVASAVKLKLMGAATITKVVVTTENEQRPLAGACIYTMPVNGGNPTFAFANEGETYTSITLNCGEGVQLKEGEATNFIFTMPPMAFGANELRFHVYSKEADGVYKEIKKETGWDYERSKITAVGPYTYEMPVYAASINGKPYENVAEAIEAFENGNFTETTMNLKKDIVLGNSNVSAANSLSRTTSTEEGDLTEYLGKESITIPAGKTLTLNLNGHSIRGEKACTEHFEMIHNQGTLIITGNGTISFKDTGNGDPNFGWGSYTIRNDGTLIIENGTIEHLGEQNKEYIQHMYCTIWQYSGSTTINGGTFSNPYYRSVRLWYGDMTINGGNFEGQVWVQAVDNTSKLTINGGTFAPRGGDGSSVFITNAEHKVGLTVTDGYFNTKIGSSSTTNFAEGSGMITGGTFTESAKTYTNAALLATGYQFVANGDGTYDVKK